MGQDGMIWGGTAWDGPESEWHGMGSDMVHQIGWHGTEWEGDDASLTHRHCAGC